MYTIILRFVLFVPLCAFGCKFFNSDNYNTKPGHLAGAFCFLGMYILSVSFIWTDMSYGQHVVFYILIFYMTPLRTFTVGVMSITFWLMFCAVSLYITFVVSDRDLVCKNDAYEFRCDYKENRIKQTFQDKLSQIMQPCFVLFFVAFLGTFISFRRERVLRRNFKTLKTNQCLTDIMRLTTDQNQQMLQSMLPQEMIEKFKLQDSALVVDTYAEVTVLFCIIDNFVEIARSLEAENLLFLLNVVYSEFDRITEETGVYKIETVGEVFMGCAGCPQRIIDHADKAARCSTQMMKAMPKIRRTLYSKLVDGAGRSSVVQGLNIKIGLNSGKIVAGVLNTPATIRFKLFGDTVNTASRMQSTSHPGKVQVSEKCYKKLVAGAEHRYYVFSEKRQVEAKGKGTLDTWFLQRMRTDKEIRELERNKKDKLKAEIVKVNEEGVEEEISKRDTGISGKIRAKLAVFAGGDGRGQKTSHVLNVKDGGSSPFSGSSNLGHPNRPSLASMGSTNGGSSSDSNDFASSPTKGMSTNPSQNGQEGVIGSHMSNNPHLARRGTFMSKGNAGHFQLSTTRVDPSGAVGSMKTSGPSTAEVFNKLYKKNYRNREKEEREAKTGEGGKEEEPLPELTPEDLELRKEGLFYNFKKITEGNEPPLSPGQLMMTLIGTEMAWVGRDDEAAMSETKYIVHKWATHLKAVRALSLFWGMYMFMFTTYALYRMTTGASELGAENAWMKPAMDAANMSHVVNCLGIGIPSCMMLIFLSFKREFFWNYHQTLMMLFLSIVGMVIIFETGLLVPKVGYGSTTMFVMTVYQYQLLFFSNRVLLNFFLCISYYLALNLFAVDYGNEVYTMGNHTSVYPLVLNDASFSSNFASVLDSEAEPPYGSYTFEGLGISDSCKEVLQQETFYYMKSTGANMTGLDSWNNTTLAHVSSEFLREGLLEVMRSPLAFWKIIQPIMSHMYFGWMLLYMGLLLVPTLQSDYHERVCYNKEVKQRENTKKMNKQQDFEEMLLKRLLPPEIVPILPEKRASNEVIAERFEEVSILFCDMVGFTKFSSELDPSELMVFLSALYAKYSAVLAENSMYTVEVIGDALLAVAGCPKRIETEDHASRALKAAFELIKVTQDFSEDLKIPVNIRVGIHSGSVIAGVVGVKDPRYHLFGEAVKVAEMRESTGEQDRVQCSHKTYENLFGKDDEVSVKFRSDLLFQRRVDMSKKAQIKLAGLDYGDCTYFVQRTRTNTRLNLRRLTLGRGQISPPPQSSKLPCGAGTDKSAASGGGAGETNRRKRVETQQMTFHVDVVDEH